MFDPARALLGTMGCAVFFLTRPVFAQDTPSDHDVTPSPAPSSPLSPNELPNVPASDAPYAPDSTPRAAPSPAAWPPIDDYSEGHGPRPGFGPPTGEYDHDGFYLRFNAGATALRAAYSLDGEQRTYTGLGPTFGAAMGGVVGQRLILFGEAQASIFSNPTLEVSGDSSSIDGKNLVSYSIGPGFAYYLDPLGLLFSGTLAVTRLTMHQQSGEGQDEPSTSLTDLGVGANLQFGKEWWIDFDWGLGAVGQLHVSSMKVTGQDARMTALAFSILLSATYN